MGAAASIVTHADSTAIESCRKTVDDTKHMNKLFESIASSADQGRINYEGSISIYNLVKYFESPNNALLNIVQDKYVLHTSHALVSGPKGQITLVKFKKLLMTMYLCSHIWKVFEIMDVLEVDKKISKEEFRLAKDTLPAVKGIEFLAPADDKEWMKEFKVLDKDNSGFVTFQELCEYTIKHIVKPEDFLDDEEEEIVIERPHLSPKALLEQFERDQELEELEEAKAKKAKEHGHGHGHEHGHGYECDKGTQLSFLTDHTKDNKELKQVIEDELVALMRKLHQSRYEMMMKREKRMKEQQEKEEQDAIDIAHHGYAGPSRTGDGLNLTKELFKETDNHTVGETHVVSFGLFSSKINGTEVGDIAEISHLKH